MSANQHWKGSSSRGRRRGRKGEFGREFAKFRVLFSATRLKFMLAGELSVKASKGEPLTTPWADC